MRHAGASFRTTGLTVIEEYLGAAECGVLREEIERFRARHELPLIHRRERGRSLRYSVMDGDVIRESCPELVALYERIGEVVRRTAGKTLVPLGNATANLNVNITAPGGEYRWHYDRNAVTAILYLNAVAGGETEIYANYRIDLGRWRVSRLQRLLDRVLRMTAARRLLGRMTVVSPQSGLLVIMRGDRSLHSVRRVEGSEERICVVMSFDEPERGTASMEQLDGYLYSTNPVGPADPNYRK